MNLKELNFTPWLRVFEHQGENCMEVVATDPSEN